MATVQSGAAWRSAPGKLETYLVGTATDVPPTYATLLAGVQPGFPVPATTNLGRGVSINLLGRGFRSSNTPTLALSIPDRGRLHMAAQVLQQQLLGGATVQQLRETWQGGMRPIGYGDADIAVPQLALRRTNYDLGDDAMAVGITQEFNAWGYGGNTISPVAPFDALHFPTIVEASDGTRRLIMHTSDAGSSPFNHGLVVKTFDPAVNTNWATLTSRNLMDDGMPGAASLAAVRLGHDIYIYLVANVTLGDITSGALYVYRLSGLTQATAALTPVAGPIYLSSRTDVDTTASVIAATVVDDAVFVAVHHAVGANTTIVFGTSTDQRDWGGRDASHGRFVSLADFSSTLFDTTSGATATAPDTITDFSFASTTLGWACTDQGRIFTTADGGKTWTAQSSPVQSAAAGGTVGLAAGGLALHALNAVNSTTVYAVGVGGLILLTTDAGVTWKVQRYAGTYRTSIPDDQWTSAADKAATDIPAVDLHAVAFDSASIGWVAGDDGYIFYASSGGTLDSGGTGWVLLLHNGPGAYRDIVSQGATRTIWLCGDKNVHDRTATRRARLVQIVDADTPASPTVTYYDPRPHDADMVALTLGVNNSNVLTELYAVDDHGNVYRAAISGDVVNGAFMWSNHLGARARDIFAVDDATVFALTDGGIWKSTDGTVASPARPVFSQQRTITTGNQAAWFLDAITGVIGGQGSIQRTEVSFDDRIKPALVTLADRSVVLACQNVDSATVEIRQIIGPLSDHPRIDIVDTALTYTAAAGEGGGYPSLVRTQANEVILSWGNPHPAPPSVAAGSATGLTGTYLYRTAVMLSTGEELPASKAAIIAVSDTKVALTFPAAGTGNTTEIYRADDYGLPFYWLASANATATTYTDTGGTAVTVSRQPSVRAYGRMNPSGDGRTWLWPEDSALQIPLGAVTPTATFTAAYLAFLRLYAAHGGQLFATCEGSGGVVGTWISRDWSALAAATGPTHYAVLTPGVVRWLVDDVYIRIVGMPAAGDSWTSTPRYEYPSSYITEESPSIYTRSVSDTLDWELRWDRADAATVALIGNGEIWEVTGFALFGTNFKTATFYLSVGTSTSSFSSKTISSACDSGTFDGGVGGTVGRESARTSGTTKPAWIVDQWAPGLQEYWCDVASVGVFRILGNSHDSLVLERASGGATLNGHTYEIFGNHFFWDGSGSNNGALNNTNYRFGRVAKIIIPAQTTALGYRRIGTAVIGTYTLASVPPGISPNESTVRGYAWNGRWRPITNTVEQTGLSGISHVSHIGRTGQTWGLSYEALEWWRRDQFHNPLLRDNRLRKAFAIVFDATDQQTARLVRLIDASEFTNIVTDAYDFPLGLREVV